MTAADATPDVSAEPTFDDLAARVDELRDRVRHSEEQALLEETLEAITEFNRAGLVELVQVLRADPRGEELLFSAVDRPEVMALLVAHGIVRVDRFKVVTSAPGRALVEVVLHEGRKHVVRRMLAEVGHPVEGLVRVKVGPIGLGDLRSGKVRTLSIQEVGELYAAVGL